LGKMGDVAREGRTVLFVSHNMAAIEHLCNQGIVLSAGRVALAGSIGEAVTQYEGMLFSDSNRANKSLPSNVLYQKLESESKSDFEVVRIELLDSEGSPQTRVCTWDKIIFRIHYFASRPVNSGSLVLIISSRHGDTLLLLSTQPDSTVPMSIQPGCYYGDCELAELPLSAGDFVVGAGLAIPNKEWLWREDSLAILTVHPRDVYRSGLAPTSSRSLLAIPHTWKV
jgi:lipopolysaccharide transport system ATP-binding protein